MQIPREERVSHSEVDTYLLCTRKHYYGYIQNIERKQVSRSLGLGSLGHSIMERVLKTPNANINDVKQWLYEFVQSDGASLELVDKLLTIFEAYFKVDPLSEYRMLAVEKTFVWKVHDGLYLPFRIDAIARHKTTNKVVVIDHKFTANFYKPWNLDLLPQIPKYIGALRQMGLPADSGAYMMFRTGFRKDAPPEEIVKLEPFQPTEARILETIREQIVISQEIQRRKKLSIVSADAEAVRVANNLVCNSCSFQEICAADLNGHATQLLLKTAYRKKENEQVFEYDD